MDDLNGYDEEDLREVEENIFEDPDGRKYRREECYSEVCAQGSTSCSCEGTGYRYRLIRD